MILGILGEDRPEPAVTPITVGYLAIAGPSCQSRMRCARAISQYLTLAPCIPRPAAQIWSDRLSAIAGVAVAAFELGRVYSQTLWRPVVGLREVMLECFVVCRE
jgi:hypothetical protein